MLYINKKKKKKGLREGKKENRKIESRKLDL